MNIRKFHLLTSIIIVATIVLLIAWDVATFNYGGVDSTISRISLRFMEVHPFVALALGALVGHLTWSTRAMTNRPREAVLLGVGLVLMVVGDLFHVLPAMMPVWPFLLGIPVGHALFGQNMSPALRLQRARLRRKKRA